MVLATGPPAVTASPACWLQPCGVAPLDMQLDCAINVWRMASVISVCSMCERGGSGCGIHPGHSTQAVDVKSSHLGPLPGRVLLPVPALRVVLLLVALPITNGMLLRSKLV